jgi:putative glutamine amidotransferase
MRAKIGLTLDYIDPNSKMDVGSYSSYPWYSIKNSYIKAVSESQGLPIPVFYRPNLEDYYLEYLDSLILTGGGFDIHPILYGESKIHHKTTIDKTRTDFEFKFAKSFLKTGKPILGICGGMQLINVIYGGTLIQDINDTFKNALNHSMKNPTLKHHDVEVIQDTLLESIVKNHKISTNTSHHQAIDKIGKGLRLNAKTSDGIIEGIEDPNHKFCLGVQWHPEWHVSDADIKIIDAFIAQSL